MRKIHAHEAERHLSESKKDDDDSKKGKAKIIVKLKTSAPANF